jgi:hypothetical protein
VSLIDLFSVCARRPNRIASVAIVAALLSASADAQDLYKDRRLGFSVHPPDKWPKIPTEPAEEYAVAKWAGKRDFGNFATELNVLFFNKVEKPKPSTKPADASEDEEEEDEPRRPEYGRVLDLFKKSGNYSSYWKRRLFDEKFELPTATREIAVKGFDAKVKLFDIYRPGGQDVAGRPARFWYLAAVYDLPDRQYVLEFSGGEPYREKLLPLYTDVIKSMRLLAAKEIEAAEDEEAVAKLSERQKAVRTAEITKRQTKGWWFKESEHYVVLTSLPQTKEEFVGEIISRLKKLRRVFEKDFPPSGAIDAVSIVRVCKNREEYLNYGAPPGSAGYWNSMQKELVLYVDGAKDFALAVLSHEAFHQYIFYCFGELSPHSWYNEGFGDYYAGATFDGPNAVIKPFRWRVDGIKTAISAKKHVPVKDIIRYSQGQYYSNADLCYSEGWSLVYFLRKGVPKGHSYEKILKTYFDVLQQSREASKAVEAAFAGVDMDRFESDWAAFIVKDQKPSK